MSEASQFQNVRETPIWQQVLDTLRQPTSVGIVISVGLHAIALVSIPLLSLDLGSQEEETLDANLVELTEQDLSQFAPQATQDFSFPSYEFDEESLSGLPSLSGQPSFPPPPPADSTDEGSSSRWDDWSYWDESPSSDTDPYSGSYSDRYSGGYGDSYSDSYGNTDYWAQYQQQWQDWLDRNAVGQPPSPTTVPTEPTPQELAQKKKAIPDGGQPAGEAEGEGATSGETSGETPGATSGGSDSGQGYAEGMEALELYYAWVRKLFEVDPALEGQIDIWEHQNPQSQEVLLPSQQAFQELVDGVPSVWVGVLVDAEGQLMNVTVEEGQNLALTALPPRRNPILQLALQEELLKQIDFPESDRPKAYWFEVNFRIRGADGDTENTDEKGSGTSTPPLNSPPMQLALQQAQKLELAEESQQRWLAYLTNFEEMPRLLEEPLSPIRVPLSYPPDVEPPAEPPRTVFAVVLDAQGSLIEDRVRPLVLTGVDRLDERAVEVLRENAPEIPITGATTAYIFTVIFVPEGEMTTPEPTPSPSPDGEPLPMKKKPPIQ
ncbi:hypothetical protein [Baaleninema sp.]|uniref:hypothetical protein n=1 Tax=Baaleninema sp. TaxID=3101197 RepID=UPI003D014BDE